MPRQKKMYHWIVRVVFVAALFLTSALTVKAVITSYSIHYTKLYEPIIPKKTKRTAIIVITSNQGLCGSYNTDIQKKMNVIVEDYPDVDYFIIGKKGQEFFKRLAKKHNIKFYPFNIPDVITSYSIHYTKLYE